MLRGMGRSYQAQLRSPLASPRPGGRVSIPITNSHRGGPCTGIELVWLNPSLADDPGAREACRRVGRDGEAVVVVAGTSAWAGGR